MKAEHRVHGDDNHHVSIEDLKVWVYRDDGMWIAHGIDVDYAAYGTTPDEAQMAFLNGLAFTIVEHLRRFKSLRVLLARGAPDELRARWVSAVEGHELSRSVEPLNIGSPPDIPRHWATVPSSLEFYRATA